MGPHADPNWVAFNKSLLDVRALADADYTPDLMEDWRSEYASVQRPRHWLRILRAKSCFPNGDVIIDYDPSGDEGKNLVY